MAKQKTLTKKQATTKRTANLLTELEAATGQVLEVDYNFSKIQIVEFLEIVRARYRADPPIKPLFIVQSKWLGRIAARFGIITADVLVERYQFKPGQAGEWIDKLITRAAANRKAPG